MVELGKKTFELLKKKKERERKERRKKKGRCGGVGKVGGGRLGEAVKEMWRLGEKG